MVVARPGAATAALATPGVQSYVSGDRHREPRMSHPPAPGDAPLSRRTFLGAATRNVAGALLGIVAGDALLPVRAHDPVIHPVERRLVSRLGLPFWLSIPAAGLFTALVGKLA